MPSRAGTHNRCRFRAKLAFSTMRWHVLGINANFRGHAVGVGTSFRGDVSVLMRRVGALG